MSVLEVDDTDCDFDIIPDLVLIGLKLPVLVLVVVAVLVGETVDVFD
jgi:hypothetical protein